MVNLNLNQKITIFSTVILIISVCAMTAVVLGISQKIFKEQSIKIYEQEIESLVSNIEHALIRQIDDVRVLGNTPPIQGIIRSVENNGIDEQDSSDIQIWKNRLKTIFNSMLSLKPNYMQLRYIGIAEDGKEIVRVDQSGREIYMVHDSALQSKGESGYFKKAITLSQGSVGFSEINYNIEHGKLSEPKILTLRLMEPVYTDKQKIFGVLVLNVNIEKLLYNIIFNGKKQYNILLKDMYGNLIYYDRDSRKILYYNKAVLEQEGFILNEVITSVDGVFDWISSYSKFITKKIDISVGGDNTHTPFVLLAFDDKSSVFGSDNEVLKDIILLVFLISLITAWLVYAYTKHNMKNLHNLAMSLSPGIVTNSLKNFIDLSDEVGMLARAFEQKTEVLKNMATHDVLTGLPNRNSLYERLEEFKLRANRSKRKFAVVFLDLNDFKLVNDKYGHDYGDDLLLKFSAKIKNAIRNTDFCARLSGDEFVILFDDIKSDEMLTEVIDRFCISINGIYIIKDMSLNVSISAGVAIYPEHGKTGDELLKNADTAMYESKKVKTGKPIFFNHPSES